MFDIVHERFAKFNTRRMARMGILYYTILYYTILYYTILYYTILTANCAGKITGNYVFILFIKQNKTKKNKKRTVMQGTSHKVGMV